MKSNEHSSFSNSSRCCRSSSSSGGGSGSGSASGSSGSGSGSGGSGGGGGGHGGAFAKKEEINYEWAQVNCRLCLMRDSDRC